MIFINELETLLKDIEKLRAKLHTLVEQKEANLLDPEIISASQVLNEAIAKYNDIIEASLQDKSS